MGLGFVFVVGIVLAFFRFFLKIPVWVHVTVVVFLLVHFVLGEGFNLYDSSSFFDKALHVASGVVIAICGFAIVHAFKKRKKYSTMSPFFVAVFAFCFALTLLVLWEVFEFMMDSLFGMNMMRWQDRPADVQKGFLGSGLVDTMWDLIVGMLGALVVCIGGYFILRKDDCKVVAEEDSKETISNKTKKQKK